MRIAVMATCLGDALFPAVPRATVEILRRLGHQVSYPLGQTCCGQMHINTGYQREALGVIRHHVDVFERALQDVEAVVVPSSSCGGAIRHQQAMVARNQGDEELAVRAQRVSDHTFDLTELLVDVLDTVDVGAYFPHTVTYHPTCHSMRVMGLGDRPERLLRGVEALTLVELPRWDRCCGFGGTFSLKNSETSGAMVRDKAAAVVESGAQLVTAADASCLMNIGGALAKEGSPVKAVHLAEILASTRGHVYGSGRRGRVALGRSAS
jgi:L-lactate dehydrogenase complex protein LldE